MYKQSSQRGSSSRFSSPQRGRFGGRRGFGGGGGAPRRKSFDPSMFVKKASIEPVEAPVVSQNTFQSFNLDQQLERNITSHGYTVTTTIQDQIIPHVLNGKDVIGIANTGTGKTAAFLIPLIQKVFTSQNERVLIVAPTRELAVQIDQELRQLSQGMRIYSAVCIGGMSMYQQQQALRRRPDFVIGTPGKADCVTWKLVALSTSLTTTTLCSMKLTRCLIWALSKM